MLSAPTPLPFSDTFAHPGDPLPEHLERVARRAEESIAPTAREEIRAIAFVSGLFHDMGKATPWFQSYLLRGGKRSLLTPHAETGALLLWWYTAQLDWPLWQRLAAFIAVRRHHGALNFQVWPDLFERTRAEWRDEDSPLHAQMESLDLSGIHAWLMALALRHDGLLTQPEPLTVAQVESRLRDRAAGGSRLRRAFSSLDESLMMLAGFGALLALDKTDAALQGESIARQALPADAVTRFKAGMFPPAGSHDECTQPGASLDQRRDQIATTVVQTWLAHPQQRLLTLTAPTGAGKTLTILHAALQMRAFLSTSGGIPARIIYCLPFTAIIDQNHAVFRSVLHACGLGDREDLLLKHHHLTDALFRTEQAEYQPDGAGQLLTETWQSELIVTTFHQLLHTLLSARNANLKRAGQLTGALVLLDEVQGLPLRYWEALRQLLVAVAATFDTRFVLLTATRPLIFQPGDALELLADHAGHFRAMSRTCLHLHHHVPLPLDVFAGQMCAALREDSRPTLIILNRRRAVRELFETLHEALTDRPLVALSTDLTPRDRRARIRLVQRLLRQGQGVIVVTTQLVEAGVDLSFPVVHRDLAPLDSIIQAAGRCNRHGESRTGAGEVHVWQLQSMVTAERPNPEFLWRRVYDAALIEVTQETLGDLRTCEESRFLELTQRYFAGCRARQDQQRIDEQLARGDFPGVEQAFRLIEEVPSVSLFVARTPCDEHLWGRYVKVRDDPVLTPAEQQTRFRPFKRALYERVIQVYARQGSDVQRDTLNRLDASPQTYDRKAGFIALPREEPSCIL